MNVGCDVKQVELQWQHNVSNVSGNVIQVLSVEGRSSYIVGFTKSGTVSEIQGFIILTDNELTSLGINR